MALIKTPILMFKQLGACCVLDYSIYVNRSVMINNCLYSNSTLNFGF